MNGTEQYKMGEKEEMKESRGRRREQVLKRDG